jgi:hypothetical protein
MTKVAFTFVVCLALAAPTLNAQSTQPAVSVDAEGEEVVYRPPSQGASRARMGGGSRTGVKMPAIEALVPDHPADTLTASPKLFWFCAEPTELAREFSLVDAETLDTVKRVPMSGAIAAGWQKLDLAEMQIALEPGKLYDWRVAVVAGTGRPSDNAVAGGTIRLNTTPTAPSPQGGAVRQASRLASVGVWYDALALLMTELENNPEDPAARKALLALLNQVNLKAAAAYAAQ